MTDRDKIGKILREIAEDRNRRFVEEQHRIKAGKQALDRQIEYEEALKALELMENVKEKETPDAPEDAK